MGSPLFLYSTSDVHFRSRTKYVHRLRIALREMLSHDHTVIVNKQQVIMFKPIVSTVYKRLLARSIGVPSRANIFSTRSTTRAVSSRTAFTAGSSMVATCEPE